MYILGICLSHNRSACLVKDGKILFAIAEERLDGVKSSTLYFQVRKKGQSSRIPPMRAISYCLDSANISIDDVDIIVADNAVTPVYLDSLKSFLPIKDKSKIKSLPPPSHHLAHACSAFFCSPFTESAILVADVYGSHTLKGTEAESGFLAKNNRIEPRLKTYQIEKSPKIKANYSLTYIYNFISLVLGFSLNNAKPLFAEVQSEAGKTMALAAYGKQVKDWPYIVDTSNNKIETGRFTQWALDIKIARVRKGYLIPIVRKGDQRISQFHKNLAYKAQMELEKGLIFLANRLYEITKSKNLCIAGGAGLNSVCNKKILDNTPFENIFIQPASTDDGTAIGCAMYGWHILAKRNNRTRFSLKNVFLGRKYQKAEIQASLRKYKIWKKASTKQELIKKTAQYIAAGKIVGWFQGGSEFGPRALGHRSLLADARCSKMKYLINKKVKSREAFRPYAPSILSEFTVDYFDLSCPSPFMLLVAKVKKDKIRQIPAVVHVDGTARVQTVTKNSDSLYYELLQEFYRLTGVPVILDTSFNIRGMPIVETPDDAIEVFFDTAMDVLVVDNYIFDKESEEEQEALVSYYEENKKDDKAFKTSLKALKRYPNNGRFYLCLAKHYYENKNYGNAIKSANKVIALNYQNNDADLYSILGMSLMKKNEYLKAIPALKQALEMNSANEEISFSLAKCYQTTNQIDLMNQELDKGYLKLKRRLKA